MTNTQTRGRPVSKRPQQKRKRRRSKSNVSIQTCLVFFVFSLGAVMLINLASDIINYSSDVTTKKLFISDATIENKFLAQIPPTYDSYSNLYAIKPPEPTNGDAKTVYLTFDDGPSDRTIEILDVLDDYGVKATFFVSWQSAQRSRTHTIDYLSEILKRGHEIGIHTYTHDYNTIYSSVDAFLNDMDLIFNFVYDNTGYRPTIMRFAGGSYNAYNKTIYDDITFAIEQRGFVYYDWNSSLEDASSKNYTAKQLANNATNYFKSSSHTIVLAHDSNNEYETVEALPLIIEYGLDNGYTFEKLDKTVKPIQFNAPSA